METNLSTFEYQKLLNTAMDIGHFLLASGAETYRVEESIQRILYAYGVKHVDVFAITNNITVTMTMADDTCYTRLRRVYSRSTNYQMVEDLNHLSRYICKERPSVEEIHSRLQLIRQKLSKQLFRKHPPLFRQMRVVCCKCFNCRKLGKLTMAFMINLFCQLCFYFTRK